MALIKGALVSFSDPLLGVLPTVVPFQYNPDQITRVFRSEAPATAGTGASNGSALNAAQPAREDYSLSLSLDATNGLEREGPLTTVLGISPKIAAIEMLMQPIGSTLLGGLAGALTGGLLGGGGASIPAGKLPLVLFLWGPGRITPVRLTALTVRETAFDELLNPIHATADLGFTVLRPRDVAEENAIAQAAATYYHGSREVKALLSLPQIAETG